MDRELNAFKSGFEYIVAHSNPPEMFIIHRREVRPDGRRDQVSGIWWILHDRVYPTPTLYDIMASRTVSLRASFVIERWEKGELNPVVEECGTFDLGDILDFISYAPTI